MARIGARRAELEAIISGTKDERVLLHPSVGLHYRQQVPNLAAILRSDEDRAKAADLLRSLINRIELSPNSDGKLDIDLYGDLAGILGLAANKNGPLDESDPSLKQVKAVVGTRNHREFAISTPI